MVRVLHKIKKLLLAFLHLQRVQWTTAPLPKMLCADTHVLNRNSRESVVGAEETVGHDRDMFAALFQDQATNCF